MAQIFQVWPAECWIQIRAWFHQEASHRVDQPGGRLDLQWKLDSLLSFYTVFGRQTVKQESGFIYGWILKIYIF